MVVLLHRITYLQIEFWSIQDSRNIGIERLRDQPADPEVRADSSNLKCMLSNDSKTSASSAARALGHINPDPRRSEIWFSARVPVVPAGFNPGARQRRSPRSTRTIRDGQLKHSSTNEGNMDFLKQS